MHSRMIFVYVYTHALTNKAWMKYPRFVQLHLDNLMPNVPRPKYPVKYDAKGNDLPPSEPYHEKIVKQTVFKAMLDLPRRGDK